MRHNRLGYFIEEGVSSIFTHSLMSFASVCVIVACLVIMGSFSLLALNIDSIIATLENENQMVVFINESYSTEEAKAVESDIQAVVNVSDAIFVSRGSAFESFVDTYDDSSIFDGLDSSVLRDRFVVYLKDISLMKETRDILKDIPGVARVSAHLEISEGFVRVRHMVTIISVILASMLFIISLFIMSNTIKLTTFERREEIAIMKMVGATSNFIRGPFVIEGLILGMFGSLTAYLLQWGVYALLTEKIIASSGLAFLTTLPFALVSVPMLVVFLAVGFLVGVVGSLIAIKNYLKV